MIKQIQVPAQLLEVVSNYLQNHNLGNRGVEDGSRRKQEVGLIGELIVYRYLKGEFPNLQAKPDGFDGGFDIVHNGRRIDVKTMERKSYVRPSYVNNFYLLQEHHHADTIVFCSYHAVAHIVEICGWMPKNELSKRGIYYTAGTQRKRTDGTSFIFRQDNYEVENKNLNNIDALD